MWCSGQSAKAVVAMSLDFYQTGAIVSQIAAFGTEVIARPALPRQALPRPRQRTLATMASRHK